MEKVLNGLENAPVATTPGIMVESEGQRAIAEVQAAIILAKRFPRNIKIAYDQIITACQRPALAESAIYSYAKGGSDITGPSIRLAEAMAQAWGNLQFGIRELDQRAGESTVEAFAWDIENNVRQVKVFQVKHVRHTKKGSYVLDDPREIYELTANQGARRMRSCILGIIPGDIVEAAVDECENTMKAKADTSPEGIGRLIDAFCKIGVEKEQIEKRIQRRIDTITAAQMVGLRKVFNSIKDGISGISDWFEVIESSEQEKSGINKAKDALKKKVKAEKQEENQTEPVLIPPPVAPEPPQMLVPTSSLHKQIEVKIGEANLNRDMFKQYLLTIGKIDFLEEKPSFKTMTIENAQKMIDTWDATMKSYEKWRLKNAMFSNA